MNNNDLQEMQDLFDSISNNKELLKGFIKGDLDIMSILVPDQKESKEMQDFMDTYFVSNIGGKTVVIDRSDINKQYDFTNFARLKSHIKEKKKIVKTDDDGNETWKIIEKSVVDRFLNDVAERFDNVVFKPSGNIKNGEYNFFTGWPYSPKESTKHHAFLDHIFNNICSKDVDLYEYILDWMAHIIQYPEKKIDKALVIRGNQGTGKGFFVQEFGSLLGNAFHHLTNMGPLTGRFNSELVNNLLVFADEVTWGGKRAEGSRLKTFISEDRINIEFKGKDVVPMNNFARLIIASNHEWVVPVEGGDRRYVVIDIDDRNKEDKVYFNNIHQEMLDGGYEALMFKLVNRDLSNRDWSKIPNTQARLDQKMLSLDHHEQWMYDSISQITDHTPWGIKGFGVKIDNKEIHEAYMDYMKKHYPNQYMKSSREISTWLTKMTGKQALKANSITSRIFDASMIKTQFEDVIGGDNTIWD